MLKAKIASSTAAYDTAVKINPLDPNRGAQLIGAKPGLMCNMPEGLHEFSFKLKEGTVPECKGFRRFNQVETEKIRRPVEKMLKAEVIAASDSPFPSGVVLALKKDGTYRFALNLHRLHDITRNDGDDSWAISRIDQVLRKCAGKAWFSRLWTSAAPSGPSYLWPKPAGSTLPSRLPLASIFG